jgi:2-succinyl-6-hydroxy-2,4-cyclohexadiene-1-carboxylate synthase
MHLLLFGGFMGDAADWDGFLEAFSRRQESRGITPVIRNAPYAETGEPPGETPFLLCGYSMGARVALALSGHPFCCGLLSVSGSPGIRDEAEREARAVADELLARRMESLSGEEVFREFLREWWAQPVFRGSTLDESARERLVRSRLRRNPSELAAVLRRFGPAFMPSLWDRWESLPVPKLAVAGENDPKYAALAREMGDHVIIPGCGHQIPLEQPDRLAAILAGFLDRHFRV